MMLEVVAPPAIRRANSSTWPGRRNIICVGVFATLVSAFLLMGTLQPALAQGGFTGWFSGPPANYDDCISRNMRGVTSEQAARAIQISCSEQFNQSDTPNPLVDLTNLFISPDDIIVNDSFQDYGNFFYIDINHTVDDIEIDIVTVRFVRGQNGQIVTAECPVLSGRAHQTGNFTCQHRLTEPWTLQIVKIMGRRISSR